MKNTIIYIGSFVLPDKTAGAQRALSLSKTFRMLGFNVVLVGIDSLAKGNHIIDTKKNVQGFETYSIKQPTTILDWIKHSVSIKEFKNIFEVVGYDNIFAVVAMEYEAIPLMKLSRLCDRKNVYLIADAEEWYEKSTLSFPMNYAKDIDTFLRMNYVYKNKIRNMICISRFFEKYEFNECMNKVYIPGTVDLAESKWTKINDYLPNDILTIGYAGFPGNNFEKERLDWLVDSIQELNADGIPCRLIIAGLTEEDLISRFKFKINENIICLGKISHIDCLNLIAKCDFSAIIREDKRVTRAGFPTKFSESLACCTPVITTCSSNLSEYIINGTNGYICKDFNKESLKETIKTVSRLDKNDIFTMHKYLKINNPLVYSLFVDELDGFIKKLK